MLTFAEGVGKRLGRSWRGREGCSLSSGSGRGGVGRGGKWWRGTVVYGERPAAMLWVQVCSLYLL
jgi:hypothetical protein